MLCYVVQLTSTSRTLFLRSPFILLHPLFLPLAGPDYPSLSRCVQPYFREGEAAVRADEDTHRTSARDSQGPRSVLLLLEFVTPFSVFFCHSISPFSSLSIFKVGVFLYLTACLSPSFSCFVHSSICLSLKRTALLFNVSYKPSSLTLTCTHTHWHIAQTSNETSQVHAGDLLHALETVTARTLHCSAVRSYLVAGPFIGLERDGLVMLKSTPDVLPAPVDAQVGCHVALD